MSTKQAIAYRRRKQTTRKSGRADAAKVEVREAEAGREETIQYYASRRTRSGRIIRPTAKAAGDP